MCKKWIVSYRNYQRFLYLDAPYTADITVIMGCWQLCWIDWLYFHLWSFKDLSLHHRRLFQGRCASSKSWCVRSLLGSVKSSAWAPRAMIRECVGAHSMFHSGFTFFFFFFFWSSLPDIWSCLVCRRRISTFSAARNAARRLSSASESVAPKIAQTDESSAQAQRLLAHLHSTRKHSSTSAAALLSTIH